MLYLFTFWFNDPQALQLEAVVIFKHLLVFILLNMRNSHFGQQARRDYDQVLEWLHRFWKRGDAAKKNRHRAHSPIIGKGNTELDDAIYPASVSSSDESTCWCASTSAFRSPQIGRMGNRDTDILSIRYPCAVETHFERVRTQIC